MPLSILLGDRLGVLTQGVRQLAPWESLTDRFALVAQRLRSTWLVRWFGTAVPIDGVDIRVTIVNVDELERRWAMIGRHRRAGPGVLGPNLTEPLLGMSGALVGMLAAPMNSLLLLVAADHLLDGVVAKVLVMLGWLSGGSLVTAVLVLGAPLLALGLVPGAIGGQESELFDVLGGLALLGRPLARLWAQLSGREPVRNPLLAQIMVLGDRLAALLAQLLGAVAILVTRFAGLLAPVRDAAVATILAVMEIAGAIGLVLSDTVGAVTSLFEGPTAVPAVLRAVQHAIARLFRGIVAMLAAGLSTLVTRVHHRFLGLVPVLLRWVVQAVRYLRDVLLGNPFVRWLLAFAGFLSGLSAWSSRRTPSTKPTSPWITSFPWPASARALATVARHRPPTPSLARITRPPLLGPDIVPPLARAMRAGKFPAGADPFALNESQRDAINRFRRPPSVFGPMWTELSERERARDSTGRVMELADAIARITPFVTRSANLVVPQAAGAFLPQLESLLARIDAELRREAAQRPTRDLEEPTTVRPVIGRLVVRADTPAGTSAEARPALEAFVGSLRRSLSASPYPVPAGG